VTPPLVLLHAFPVDSRMWDPLRAALGGDVEVLTPDQRGFGRAPAASGTPDLDAVAADVSDLLDDRGIDRAVIGGCSMGGYVAMALLRRAPERVAGLLLVDTRHDADDEARAATRLTMAARADDEGTAWLADVIVPALLAAGTPDASPELAGRLRAMISAQSPAGVAWAQRAMAARPDSTEVLRAFDGPALVLVGERDAICPPELARGMTELLAAGELVELPGCGHLTPLEAPAESADAITDWLSRSYS
jgi:pimeloyl-ACP methyl ester carboxylesterase